jgi:AcrR family transcriptional regulator
MTAEALRAGQSYHHGNVKEALLTAAKKILETERVQSLTMRRLAKEVGVTPTAVYNYFADKDELIMAIKMELFEGFYSIIFPEEHRGDDPEKRLADAGYNYYLYSIHYRSYFDILFNYYLPPEILTDEYIECACRSEELLRDVVRDLYEKFEVAYDEDLLIKSFLSSWTQLHGLVMLINTGAIAATAQCKEWPERFAMTDNDEVRALIEDFVQKTVTSIQHCSSFRLA